MKENKEPQHQPDLNLDIPAEANRGKHINFREVEEESASKNGINQDDFAEQRKKEWQEGLEAGERARRNAE